MSEQLDPKLATSENKTTAPQPRYEPPQIIDLVKASQAQGGDPVCGSGSAPNGWCTNGNVAGVERCTNGNFAE